MQLAIASLSACSLFFSARLITILLLSTLGCSLFLNRHLLWRLGLILFAFVTIFWIHPHPIGQFTANQCEGIFTPSKMTEDLKQGYIRLEGTLEIKHRSKNYLTPLRLSLRENEALFSQYHVKGSIKSLEPFRMQSQGLQIQTLGERASLSYDRFILHKKMYHWIVERCDPYLREGKLLSALFIGTKPDDSSKRAFARNGLQHVLAISGLHFGLIAALFSVLLIWISHLKMKKVILLILLTLYFILLTPSPSILRAYIASSSYLLSGCFNRKLLPLNALGLGVLLGCLIDPMSEISLSFELSFLATFAILLLFKPLSILLNTPLQPSQSLLQKWKGTFHRGLINHLCLTIAASSMTIPLLLSTFHQFPLLSIYWNLFIPYLIGLAMTLFAFCALASLLLTLPFQNLIHLACQGLKKILELLEEPRRQGEIILSLSPTLMICVIFLFAFMGIVIFKNNIKN